MFGSGIPTAEKPTAKRFFILSQGPNAREDQAAAWENYKGYLQKNLHSHPTPAFLVSTSSIGYQENFASGLSHLPV